MREFGRSSDGLPLRVELPGRTPTAILVAATHGEEPETLYLATRLVERVRGADACVAIVPCLNPDGILRARRQNAAGVDLNRNFPARSWRPDPSFTFPPGCTDRRRPNRTNRSSPGTEPASEPETRALLALLDELRPRLVVDLHSPLELLLTTPAVAPAVLEPLAAAAGLDVRDDLDVPTPGALRDWCTDAGIGCITYELEHAGLPALCTRHLPGLERLLVLGA